MSEWIKCSERMPSNGQVVDIWVPSYKPSRMCSYRFNKNFKSQKGNDFFDPIHSGYSCIRDATHWMPLPAPPAD